jgi:hypothetical protein
VSGVRGPDVRMSCAIIYFFGYVGFWRDCKSVFAALTHVFGKSVNLCVFGATRHLFAVNAVLQPHNNNPRAGETSGLRTTGLPDPSKKNTLGY